MTFVPLILASIEIPANILTVSYTFYQHLLENSNLSVTKKDFPANKLFKSQFL